MELLKFLVPKSESAIATSSHRVQNRSVSWHRCVPEVAVDLDVVYVANETPMRLYQNTHILLGQPEWMQAAAPECSRVLNTTRTEDYLFLLK